MTVRAWNVSLAAFLAFCAASGCGGDDASGPIDGGGDSSVPIDSAAPDADGGAMDADTGASPDGAPADAATDTGTSTDGGSSDADTGTSTDGAAMDAACVPETDMALCTAAGAECGDISVTDRCGGARTPACGSCTAPDVCGGVTANECGCDVPTEVRSATCSYTSSGFRLRWGGDTTSYAYEWSSSGSPPASCTSTGSSPLFGSVGMNSMILPGGPGIGECWYVRLCTWETMCVSADYSPGVVFQACVNTSGTGGTCTPG
jgi:hypothetical protein